MKLNIEGVKGCTDGGCVFGHPGGMHTNGGCHCLHDIRPAGERLRITRNVYLLVKEVEKLRNDLTACQLERDASQRAQREAEAETGRALAAHALAVRDLQLELDQLQQDISTAYRLRDAAEGRFCTALMEVDRIKAELTRAYLRRDVLTHMLYQDGREPPREAVAGDLGV